MSTTLAGSIGLDHYRATLQTPQHTWHADEPLGHGGADTAPSPGQLLLSSLAACKLITVRMYADRKGWALRQISIELEMNVDTSTQPVQTRIQCRLHFDGDLDAEQTERLLAIADKCPTHRILSGDIAIESNLAS